MSIKRRLSASVDADLLQAGQQAVASGAAASLSEWVNEALRRQAEHDRRLRAAGEFITAFEAEHGRLTDVEIDEARRRRRARAVVVRGGRIMKPAPDDA